MICQLRISCIYLSPEIKEQVYLLSVQQEAAKMAELNSSLTAMDWLPKLSVGPAIAGHATPNNPLALNRMGVLQRVQCGQYEIATKFESNAARFGKAKPPYSYANLITFAINSSPKKKMTLSDIYEWISDNFPYYKDAGNGWKVCIYPLFSMITIFTNIKTKLQQQPDSNSRQIKKLGRHFLLK